MTTLRLQASSFWAAEVRDAHSDCTSSTLSHARQASSHLGPEKEEKKKSLPFFGREHGKTISQTPDRSTPPSSNWHAFGNNMTRLFTPVSRQRQRSKATPFCAIEAATNIEASSQRGHRWMATPDGSRRPRRGTTSARSVR